MHCNMDETVVSQEPHLDGHCVHEAQQVLSTLHEEPVPLQARELVRVKMLQLDHDLGPLGSHDLEVRVRIPLYTFGMRCCIR